MLTAMYKIGELSRLSHVRRYGAEQLEQLNGRTR